MNHTKVANALDPLQSAPDQHKRPHHKPPPPRHNQSQRWRQQTVARAEWRGCNYFNAEENSPRKIGTPTSQAIAAHVTTKLLKSVKTERDPKD
jgi:hypothetical protein